MIRRPGVILALLTGLNLLNYIDRFVLSAVLPRIKDEFGLLDSVSGTLATVFLLGYFLTSPLFGVLADRRARKGIIAAGIAVWSVATVASGLATGVWSLAAARAVVGVGEASYATLAPTIIDDIAPPDKKGRWLAIFFGATPVGAALGFVAGGVLQHRFGWRGAFFWTGGPGLVLAGLCVLIQEPARKLVPARAHVLHALGPLLRTPLYVRAVLGFAAYTFAIGALGFWAPTFLVRRYGLPLATAGIVAGGATVVGGAGGTAIGGIWADLVARRKPGRAEGDRVRDHLRISAIGSAIATPIMLLSLLAPTAGIAILVFFFAEIAVFLCTSPINAAVLHSVPTEVRASAMAISIFAIHLFGDLWSPPLVGALADRFPIQWAMTILPVAVAGSAIVWWVKSPQGRGSAPHPTKIAME
jgi:MFS family permease